MSLPGVIFRSALCSIKMRCLRAWIRAPVDVEDKIWKRYGSPVQVPSSSGINLNSVVTESLSLFRLSWSARYFSHPHKKYFQKRLNQVSSS